MGRLKIADVKELLTLYDRSEITLGRLTELLNERFNKKLGQLLYDAIIYGMSLSEPTDDIINKWIKDNLEK